MQPPFSIEQKGFISLSIKREKDGTKVDLYHRFHLKMIFLKDTAILTQ